MSSVAMNYVAAIMSQNQSVKTSTKSETSGFGKVFQKSYQNVSKQSNKDANTNVRKKENQHKAVYKQNKVIDNSKEIVNDRQNREKVTDDVKADLIREIRNKMKEVTSKEGVSNEDLEKIEEMMLEEVANIVGVSVNDLKSLLQEMDLGVMDLFDNNNLKMTLQQFFDLSSDGELIQNEELFDVFKSMKALFNDVDNKALKELYQEVESSITDKSNDDAAIAVLNQEAVTVLQTDVPNETAGEAGRQGTQNINNQEELKNSLESKVEVVDMRDENFIKEKDGEQTSDNHNGQSFTELFSNAINEKTTDVTIKANGDVVYREINANEILNQVVTKIKVELGNANSTMSIQLTPENLGKVALSVSSENGALTGNIVAENNAVKEILELNIANLKATLEEQGMKVDDIKVVVGNTNQFFEKQEQQQQFKSNQNKKGKKISKLQLVEELEEEISEDTIKSDNHSVEYSA